MAVDFRAQLELLSYPELNVDYFGYFRFATEVLTGGCSLIRLLVRGTEIAPDSFLGITANFPVELLGSRSGAAVVIPISVITIRIGIHCLPTSILYK